MQPANGAEPQPSPGTVELREDAPLSAGRGGGGGCGVGGGGPRVVLASFGALSAAITLALLTQIYYGDYEVVPHGSVSCGAAACSAAGARALKAGGRALDAAAAAALCLAVLAPHRTSLDASGSLLYWEYRQSRTQAPTLAEWGAAGAGAELAGVGAGDGAELAGAEDGARPPRLVAALAALHAQWGALPWPDLLQPAITLAEEGYVVSPGLAAALAESGGAGGAGGVGGTGGAGGAGALRTDAALARYLRSLQHNTSSELTALWGAAGGVRRRSAGAAVAAGWLLYAGGAAGTGDRAGPVARALAAALQPPPLDANDAAARAVSALGIDTATTGGGAAGGAAGGVASGLAVVDSRDTYAALVTGLSTAFGSGPAAGAGWRRDRPPRALDLAPALLTDQRVCGTRYVVGAESAAALAQVGAALAAGAAPRDAVERPRAGAGAVNLVRQAADALLSHADSRGGGIASRF